MGPQAPAIRVDSAAGQFVFDGSMNIRSIRAFVVYAVRYEFGTFVRGKNPVLRAEKSNTPPVVHPT
jgi:hypothetical protein